MNAAAPAASLARLARPWRLPLLCLLASFLISCGTWDSVPAPTELAREAFTVHDKTEQISTDDAIGAFEAAGAPGEYTLGESDEIYIDVVGHPELSGRHLMGPDGQITLPVAGPLDVRNLTRRDAAAAIRRTLSPYYQQPQVTVRVDAYNSNQIIVLGRVENPGPQHFVSPPRLLETLSNAGGLPVLRPEQNLTRCAIFRGDSILWVDLRRLLTGEVGLNVRLKRGDVVFIPDAFDTPIYVLGAVTRPGAYRLTPQMSFLDALGQAGGPTREADLGHLHVIRPSRHANLRIPMVDVLRPDPSLIVALEEGDIVYVPRNAVAQIGFILHNVNPFSQILSVQQIGSSQ